MKLKTALIIFVLLLASTFFCFRDKEANSLELTFFDYFYSINKDQRLQTLIDSTEGPLESIEKYYSGFDKICTQEVINILIKHRLPYNFELPAFEKSYSIEIANLKLINLNNKRKNFTLHLIILDSTGNQILNVTQSGQIETDNGVVTYFNVNNIEDLIF
jgi:hypothetical protein